MRSRRTPRFGAALLALAIVAAVVPALVVPRGSARALQTTFTVTTTADTNDGACTRRDCSLREAIIAANALADAEIVLPAGTFRLSIAGRDEEGAATGDLDIRAGMTIRGKGARKTLIDGRSVDRVFHLPFQGTTPPFTVNISGVTVTGGDPGVATGGGIAHHAENARLVLTNSAVRGNRATQGGGVDNLLGAMTITGSTVSGNRAPGGEGGGVLNAANMRLENSTVSGNRSASGGGIMFQAGPMTVINTTVAFNTAAAGGGLFVVGSPLTFFDSIVANNESDDPGTRNCNKPVGGIGNNLEDGTSCGFSLSDADPKLGPLRDNGGPTDTHALGKRSRAIDAGSSQFVPTDQRGVVRPQGPAIDVGAFELQRRRRSAKS